jgi:DNA-binding NarL/FixJ family response regulator
VTAAKIRVMIADDHTLVREGLAQLLRKEADIEVVGEASTGREVLKAVEETAPDVLLLDLVMPEMDGLEVLPQIRERSPSTKVLVMTGFFDRELVFRTLCDGAKGYLLKAAPSTELARAIRAVHAGQAWVERSVMGQLLEELPRFAQEERVKRRGRAGRLLSRREAEIARLVAEGLSNKEIADRLSVSEKTVKSHLVSIFRKLRIRHRLELALHTLQQDSFLSSRTQES